MTLPVLDPQPSGKPADWSFSKIQQIAGKGDSGVTPYPDVYKNPYVKLLAPRDQSERGTCFVGGTKILMEDFSLKPIMSITVGDYVITHTGAIKKVTKVMKRIWQGNTIKIQIYGLDDRIECTREHPILTKDGWKNAEDITTTDFIAIPTTSHLIRDTTLYTYETDPEFLWVLGMYIAEGSVDIPNTPSGWRTYFSLGSTEMSYAIKIKKIMAKYGASSTINIKQEHNVISVRVNGRKWVKVFQELGGQYASGKIINPRLLSIDPSLQYNIFKGWADGDGHIKTRRITTSQQVVTTSYNLVRQMQYILLRNGIRGNIQKRSFQEDRQPSWCLEINGTGKSSPYYGKFDGDIYYSGVRNIETLHGHTGRVYNLEIEDDHSYIAETMAVHNCVGQSTAYCYDLLYMMLTKDVPTDADKAKYKKDVIDTLGTLHDILFPQSASAEGFYQVSRKIGNVTYPSGSEIRLSSRAWVEYGMNLEENWHTDKTGKMVWMYEPRKTTDGGLSPSEASVVAAVHRAEGYAQVGTLGYNPSWEQVCSAIYAKGFVLGAIPVYANYASMQGGDGSFPDPRGELAGFHALCFYGYDENNLYLVHSWGDWCGMYGSISRNFFRIANDLIQFFVILDANEVKIARDTYKSVLIAANVPAKVTVNGTLIGNVPIKIPMEPGKSYEITVSADGYVSQTRTLNDASTDQMFTLEAVPVPPKPWWEILIAWIKKLFGL